MKRRKISELFKFEAGLFPSEEFQESDAPVKFHLGGVHVNHRLCESPRDFVQKLVGTLVGMAIFVGLVLVLAIIVGIFEAL